MVDLTGYVTFGADDRQRISVKLQNLLGEDYFTRTNRATRDTGGSYLVHYRGVPRTLNVAYSYTF